MPAPDIYVLSHQDGITVYSSSRRCAGKFVECTEGTLEVYEHKAKSQIYRDRLRQAEHEEIIYPEGYEDNTDLDGIFMFKTSLA